ncbi:MAG: glycosyltransferase family 8 protein, partial [Candidatus Paceibacterota bacterium]
DGDILVRRELATLLQATHQAPLYAVSDKGVSDFSYLGHDMKSYFNSGVLMYNLELMPQEVLSVPVGTHLRFHDQDVLNIYFKNNWSEIDRSYNAMTPDYQRAGRAYLEHAELSDPHIVHFNTYLKPWQYGARHPFRKEYFDYWRKVYKEKLHPEWNGVCPWMKTLYHTFIPYTLREAISLFRYRHKC